MNESKTRLAAISEDWMRWAQGDGMTSPVLGITDPDEGSQRTMLPCNWQNVLVGDSEAGEFPDIVWSDGYDILGFKSVGFDIIYANPNGVPAANESPLVFTPHISVSADGVNWSELSQAAFNPPLTSVVLQLGATTTPDNPSGDILTAHIDVDVRAHYIRIGFDSNEAAMETLDPTVTLKVFINGGEA